MGDSRRCGRSVRSRRPKITDTWSPLPRDLAFWYTGFTVCLERAHELNELARRDEPGCLEAALELAVIQRSELAELMDAGDNLLRRLREQTDKLTF